MLALALTYIFTIASAYSSPPAHQKLKKISVSELSEVAKGGKALPKGTIFNLKQFTKNTGRSLEAFGPFPKR
jgi:hypothetical protein